jgi:hypothetical protein
VHKIAESQKLRGSLAEFNKVGAQLFKVWFKRSTRPFYWEFPWVEWIKLIPLDSINLIKFLLMYSVPWSDLTLIILKEVVLEIKI